MRNVIAEMSLAHYQDMLKTTQTAILPVGATEGYGHHLPLGSDWLVTYEVAKRAAAKAGCFVAPPVTYGFFRRSHVLSGHFNGIDNDHYFNLQRYRMESA